MRNHQRPRVTDAEREARRAADRERVTRAAQELLTSDGWARWVRARGMFHSYSAFICSPPRRKPPEDAVFASFTCRRHTYRDPALLALEQVTTRQQRPLGNWCFL